jgi:2'-5' RNA ligase
VDDRPDVHADTEPRTYDRAVSEPLPADLDDLVSHWKEIPDWPPERSLHACYFTTSDQPELRAAVADYQAAMADLGGLDLILPDWLHMTVQGIRFVDQVEPERMVEVAELLDAALSRLDPFAVMVERPVVTSDSALMPIRPVEPVAAMRDEIRAVLHGVPGLGELFVLPGQDGDFDPHVSIAYVNDNLARQALVDAIDACPREPVGLVIRQVSLMTLMRSDHKYHWVDERPIRLGSRRAAGAKHHNM